MFLLPPVLVLAGCWKGEGSDAGIGARHVILISLDTTRADYLGCYGASQVSTPRLDGLAREGILLADYATVVNTTLASHVSLFSGRYPHSHGTPRNGFTVNQDNVMLPELLKEAGFHTAAFLGSFALDSRFGFDQGFEHYDETFELLVGEGGADQNQRRAEAVTDAVINYLRQRPRDNRLFLFVHYFDPHMPYDPPAPYNRMYDEARLTASDGTIDDDPAGAEAARRLYAGEISYMDSHVGRLVDYLRESGILDEALLVVTGDHGENLGEHGGYFEHGFTAYQTTMAAPAILRLPRAAWAGTVIQGPRSSIDILPSVLSFLGLEIPTGVDGSAIDLSDPSSDRGRHVLFGESTKPWQVETDPRWYNALKARFAREGTMKLIDIPYRGLVELYDLSSDPGERVDLLTGRTPADDERAARLEETLEAWTDSANPLPSRFDPEQADETTRRLKALGYLQ